MTAAFLKGDDEMGKIMQVLCDTCTGRMFKKRAKSIRVDAAVEGRQRTF